MKLYVCLIGVLLCALHVTAFPHPQKDVPPQCVDPTFACQDLESAKLCGVVKSCIHDIWATMTAPDDNDEICDICKEMVKEARDQLLSNMTQEEIKEVFEGSCKLLPIKLVADACIKVVDEIIPQLVEMLASRMDPNMVCTVSGLCNPISTHQNNLYKLFRLIRNLGTDVECSECTTLVTDVKVFLKDTPEDEVKTYIEKFCDEKIPSYLCDIAVDSYFPSIYSYLVSTDAKTVCSSAGACPKVCNFDEKQKVNDELVCEFCEHVLQHVKDLITANSTAEEFRTALLNFCNHTGSFHEKCTALVNDYYDMIFDYIRKLDTKGVCTLIGLCTNEKCSQMPLIKLIPAKETRHRIPLIKLQPARSPLIKLQPARSPLIKLQPARPVQDDLSAFPLVRLVPEYVLNKKQLKESNDIYLPQVQDKFTHPMLIFKKDTECAFCKAISFYLKQDLKEKSKFGVRAALDGLCDRWVKDFPKECQNFLNKYSTHFQYEIAKGVEIDSVCDSFKACDGETDKSEIGVRVISESKAGPFCDLCKDAMTEVENVLSDPRTKDKIKNLLDQSCKILPQSLRSDCVSFLDSNVDALIEILQQELRPDNICPALKLCLGLPRISVPPRVKDLECDICKDVVSSLREKLSNPDSKKVVLVFLEEGCARLPGSLSQECKTFVDENIDTILSMIVQELDPDTACSILKICPGSIKKEEPEKVNGVECELCKEVVSKLVDMIKDKQTEEEIKEALDKVCTLLPNSITEKCENFVNKYTDLLVQILAEELDPQLVCAALNVCPSSIKKERKRVEGVECELCMEVVSKLVDMIKDKQTEEEIKKALDEVCSLLPNSIAQKCENFVNKYADLLVEILAEELVPEVVCAALRLCPFSTQKEAPKKVNDMECELCKEVVSKLVDMVKDKQSEEEIKEALDKVCSLLPDTIAQKCEKFVNEYTDILVQLIAQELDPQMVCAALHLCPSSLMQVKPKKVKDLECDLCREVVSKVEEMIKDRKTEDEIKAALDKVCSILPQSLAQKCENFVNQYTDLLITLLAQEMDPEMICAALNVCPANSQYPVWKSKAQDLECQGCQYALHFLQEQLNNPDTQGEIKNFLKRLCDILPDKLSQNCEAFVDEYGAALLAIISQEIDPTLCVQLQFCTNQTRLFHKETSILHPFKMDECSVCTTVVDYIDKLLEEDDVDKEITKLVEKVCKVLPASYQDKCASIIETYGTYILQMIGQVADSKEVCQEVDLCSRPPGHVHLLGGNKCTFGPSYWCKSTAHASACKAEDFCKEKFWSN